jgi:hypothetical protein
MMMTSRSGYVEHDIARIGRTGMAGFARFNSNVLAAESRRGAPPVPAIGISVQPHLRQYGVASQRAIPVAMELSMTPLRQRMIEDMQVRNSPVELGATTSVASRCIWRMREGLPPARTT